MTTTIVYLTTLSSQWRLVPPAFGDDKATNSKTTIVAECAAEHSNWSKGPRALIRALVCLCIADKYFRCNKEATIMVGMVAVILTR